MRVWRGRQVVCQDHHPIISDYYKWSLTWVSLTKFPFEGHPLFLSSFLFLWLDDQFVCPKFSSYHAVFPPTFDCRETHVYVFTLGLTLMMSFSCWSRRNRSRRHRIFSLRLKTQVVDCPSLDLNHKSLLFVEHFERDSDSTSPLFIPFPFTVI